ncbi:NADPH-dependent aldehyde reductase 1, chloroplastic-like isoform X2 [Prosopis cineraria]|nr:NADPH-dependent aldehyde reductase 1, chloroplastic-like isoform X2 [Prosopis cineraria]XP_054786496.1 NADPH-dependent aldehyde reductase 1, chloroplastic-like isoform X2 [Prosopis cineraria]
MASDEQKFPPQSQQTHPGQEHVMDPTPQSMIPDYKPSNKLRGKVALVTGGDSGIGRAVCISFAKEGATVAFTYVKGLEDKDKDDTLQILLQCQTADAKEPMAIASDIGYEENCRQVVDVVVKEYGRIDILVNNAAEQHMTKSLDDITEPRLERVFRTNIFSQFFLVRHAVRHMKEGSAIINSTSVNAYSGNPMTLDYTATKGAIVAFTRGLALHLVSKGIRVNAVAPGPVWTPLQPASMPPEMIQNLGSDVPMNRAAQPSEIAPCYVFLASLQDSSYFTGQVLHPNGGMIVNA